MVGDLVGGGGGVDEWEYYFGGDNIPVSPCGWQHLNSWLVHDSLVGYRGGVL